jgi:hypothetical protein
VRRRIGFSDCCGNPARLFIRERNIFLVRKLDKAVRKVGIAGLKRRVDIVGDEVAVP